ncbi:amidohydrolase family protein [Gulosibacter molinativorax]|uniref:Amidohydrolase n=1 Tax=Gulosibacter molinativorax TaxID=256821 RepID=A0ABT7CA95_9MICO|nr:amidohydrolase family protein [Gulosibacter molinativorax]MDJ1371566.1 amidohydrolase [Gulosibacter molinativorax]QUY61091.1 Amidohydrolase 2 [Gulosibacter molinativorax]
MSTRTLDSLDLGDVPLFDHHCHGVIPTDVDRVEFEALISESSRPATAGTTRFDSQVGFQVLANCAPILGLEPFCEPDEYIARRRKLGAEEVNRRLLRAAHITVYGIETGHGADRILGPEQMAEMAKAHQCEIVRLERLAEDVFERLRDTGTATSTEAVAEIACELDARLETAVGVKTIAAYRIGFDFEDARPERREVEAAAARLLAATGSIRLDDSVMIRHLIWLAIDRACVIQVHVGYGDDDVDLHRCNPLLLTRLLRASIDSGARFTLLHCYPFHREAGYLADVFPHVYFDVGLGINYTGSRSEEIIAESLELAPFGKILFSSDAWGAAELYYLGAMLFRRGLTAALTRFAKLDRWPVEQCERVARMIGYDNAARLYGFDPLGLIGGE